MYAAKKIVFGEHAVANMSMVREIMYMCPKVHCLFYQKCLMYHERIHNVLTPYFEVFITWVSTIGLLNRLRKFTWFNSICEIFESYYKIFGSKFHTYGLSIYASISS